MHGYYRVEFQQDANAASSVERITAHTVDSDAVRGSEVRDGVTELFTTAYEIRRIRIKTIS